MVFPACLPASMEICTPLLQKSSSRKLWKSSSRRLRMSSSRRLEEFGDLAEKSGRLDGTVSVVMEEVPMMMAHLGGVSAEIEKISYLNKSLDDLHIKYKELQAYKDDQEARLSGEVEKASNLQQSLDDLHTKCNELQAAKDALKKDAELERHSIELNFKESFEQMKSDFHKLVLQITEVTLSGIDQRIAPLEVALSQFST